MASTGSPGSYVYVSDPPSPAGSPDGPGGLTGPRVLRVLQLLQEVVSQPFGEELLREPDAPFRNLAPAADFKARHIGPSAADISEMLAVVRASSLDDLIDL